MDIIQAVILGIVEGISEFLPISSTGHLNLSRVLLGIPKTEFFTTFQIFIQLGAILSIVVIYFNTISKNINVWKKILTAFIPTAIIGLILGKFIKEFLISNEYLTLVALFVGGIILILLELMHKEKDTHAENIENISYINCALIGVSQAVAAIPGVSRSAATIIGALILGTKRKTAVEFSFLLAIPTMIAATIFDLNEANFSFTPNELLLMAIGFTTSFLVALFVVKWFLKYVQTHTFIPFGIYRIIASILFYLLIIK